MRSRKPDYEDWNKAPDLRGEVPDSPQRHRIVVWLWIIGLVVFSGLIWLLGLMTSYLRQGTHTAPQLFLDMHWMFFR